MFAHLGFIRDSGGRWGVDKGQQICLQSTAADMGQPNNSAPIFADSAQTGLTSAQIIYRSLFDWEK